MFAGRIGARDGCDRTRSMPACRPAPASFTWARRPAGSLRGRNAGRPPPVFAVRLRSYRRAARMLEAGGVSGSPRTATVRDARKAGRCGRHTERFDALGQRTSESGNVRLTRGQAITAKCRAGTKEFEVFDRRFPATVGGQDGPRTYLIGNDLRRTRRAGWPSMISNEACSGEGQVRPTTFPNRLQNCPIR